MSLLAELLARDSLRSPTAKAAKVAKVTPPSPKLSQDSQLSQGCGEKTIFAPPLAELLTAAMRACDFWGDGPEARAALRTDIEATPRAQRAELLASFERYPVQATARTRPQAKPANRALGRLSGASWVPLAEAYYLHHWQCPQCCAAGGGHGERCAVGAGLWAAYQEGAGHD